MKQITLWWRWLCWKAFEWLLKIYRRNQPFSPFWSCSVVSQCSMGIYCLFLFPLGWLVSFFIGHWMDSMLLERSGFEIGVAWKRQRKAWWVFGLFCWSFFLSFRLHLTLVFAANRHDEVDDNFNTTLLGEAMCNGSVDESLATVNLLAFLDEKLWWPGFLLDPCYSWAEGRCDTLVTKEKENKWLLVIIWVDGMRIIRARVFVCT